MQPPPSPRAVDSTPAVSIGDLRVLVREGDAFPAGGRYEKLHAGTINDAGELAYSARLSSGEAIVTGGRVLVRAGEPAPGGGRYTSFPELELSGAGRLIFRATLDDGAEGLYLSTPDSIVLIARAGGRSPNGHEYHSFRQVTIGATVLADGAPYHRLAYVAQLADGRHSLIVHASYTTPTEVLTTGAELAGGVVADLSISEAGLSVGCVATLTRDGRRWRKALVAHEDLVLWGEHLEEGEPLAPGDRTVARLLDPPACVVQIGVVAVEFAGGSATDRSGEGALVSRPCGDDPEVIARTGDPAPGLSGETLHSFGVPVASSGLPPSLPFGVASPVRLRSGTDALWVGVFGQYTPLAGVAMVPVVDGDRTDDDRRLVVSGVRPVKLTNTGTLLLSARLTSADDHRTGLLTLDGLFGMI